MKIAIASGKGGTGKTTVAINLAMVSKSCKFLDCDVEEPNSNLYFKIKLKKDKDVMVKNPEIDLGICTFCRKCSEFCKYNALAVLPSTVIVFNHICNGCGGCKLVCPVNAISEVSRCIGVIEGGKKENIDFYHGLLNIGEARSPPLINELKKYSSDDELVIMDAPPGSSCPFVATVNDADYVILVTEPTPFGLHDLIMVVDVLKELCIPFGVVINKYGIGYDGVERYLSKENITVIGRIPNDLEIAKLGSLGDPLVKSGFKWQELFRNMLDNVLSEARR